MKRCILLALSFVLLLVLIACAVIPEEPISGTTAPEVTVLESTEPDVTVPEPTSPEPAVPNATGPIVPDVTDPDITEPDVTDPDVIEVLAYDMTNCKSILSVFGEKAVEQWNVLGQFSLRLEGLHTPVTLNMDGTSVLSVTAYDQTVELYAMASDYFDGYSAVDYIRSTEDAVVIGIRGGESPDDFILITKDKTSQYPNKRDGHVAFWVEDDGTLAYRQTFLFRDDIEEQGNHVLYQLTSRDQVLYVEGQAEIINGEAVFTPEKTVVFSDHFDADAMFAEAKAEGRFEEYETVDELFEANKAGM